MNEKLQLGDIVTYENQAMAKLKGIGKVLRLFTKSASVDFAVSKYPETILLSDLVKVEAQRGKA